MMAGGLSQAMEEGKLAGSQGESDSENPYEAGSPESEEWLEGYRYATTHNEDDEPTDE